MSHYTPFDTTIESVIPWQLQGMVFYNVDPGTKVSREWAPVAQPTPGFNVGLPLALNNVVDIEIDADTSDERLAADDWIVSLDLPPTFSYTSRRKYGIHYIFRVPEGLELKTTKPFPKIEMRAGKPYSLVPPSVVDGIPYAIANDAEIAELPKSGFKLFRVSPTGAERPSAALAHLPLAAPGRMIPEGRRNDTLFKHERTFNWQREWWAGVDASQAVSEAAVYALNAEYCNPPLDPREVARTVHSARQDVNGPPAWKVNPARFIEDHYADLRKPLQAVLFELYNHGLVARDGKNCEVMQTPKRIGDAIGRSGRQVQRYIKELEALGKLRKMSPDEPSARTTPIRNPTPFKPPSRFLVFVPPQDEDKTTPTTTVVASIGHSYPRPLSNAELWSNIFVRKVLLDGHPDVPMLKLRSEPRKYLDRLPQNKPPLYVKNMVIGNHDSNAPTEGLYRDGR